MIVDFNLFSVAIWSEFSYNLEKDRGGDRWINIIRTQIF